MMTEEAPGVSPGAASGVVGAPAAYTAEGYAVDDESWEEYGYYLENGTWVDQSWDQMQFFLDDEDEDDADASRLDAFVAFQKQ